MKCSPRFNRLLVAGIVATATAAGPVAQMVHAEPTTADVPTDIRVPEGHKAFLVGHGVGVQIYSCNLTGGTYGWGFAGPRANLYADNGKLLTTHFGGPTWQAADGSYVVGKKVKEATVDPNAIPWLLLSTVSTSAGPDGDRLAETTHIQRTETTGGLMPDADECNENTIGTVEEVPYTAEYTFWKETGA